MTSPFDPAPSSIPVTIVAHGPLPADDDAALIVLEPALHEHDPGTECLACAARGDIRAMLFDLLTAMRAGDRPEFHAVVVDASRLKNPEAIAARLDPHSAAMGLRDHTVLKSFHLSEVI